MGLSYPIVPGKEDQSPQTIIDLIVELRERLSGKGLDHRPHHRVAVGASLRKVVVVNSIHRHLRGAGHLIAVRYKRLWPPTSALQPSYPTNVGRPTSRTASSPTARTPRSCASSTTTQHYTVPSTIRQSRTTTTGTNRLPKSPTNLRALPRRFGEALADRIQLAPAPRRSAAYRSGVAAGR
jgi:hypothetical protein